MHVVSLTVVVAFAVLGLAGLLGERYTELDVNSGRVRTRVFFLGVVVSEKIEDTSFSQAVVRNTLQSAPADYRFACKTTAGLQRLFGAKHSCGEYAKAIATLRNMMVLFELQPELRGNERTLIAEMMSLLRAGEVRRMGEFVDSLDNLLRGSTE